MSEGFNIRTKSVTKKQGEDILISLNDLETVLNTIKTNSDGSATETTLNDVKTNTTGIAAESTLNDVKVASESTSSVLETADEGITHGLRSINTDHGAIHLGWGYCAHLYHADLAQNAKKVYRYKAPTTKYAHIKSIQVNSAGATVRVRLVKNPTITVAGTEIDCICNLNHNSNSVAESKIYDGDAEFTGGETWCQIVIHGDTVGTGTDANKSKSSGSFIQSDYLEYVTKSGGEDYIIEIENIDTKNVPALDISIDMFFYEEPQGIAAL